MQSLRDTSRFTPFHSVMLRCLAICLALSASLPIAHGDDPVDRIDRAIAAGWESAGVTPVAECSDEQLVRRIYLDLAGRIPTPQEQADYIEDSRADKRRLLIDRLLESDEHIRHLTDIFDTLLMGRGNSQQYAQRKQHQWRSWLTRAFQENRPWNRVVADILLARPDAPEDQGVIWFLYERHNDHQKIAEAIAPAFFGIRIECAQCHDHMLATEIEQAHYWGLVAFFNRSSNQDTSNGPRIAESAIGGFSEFANLEGSSSPNLLTFFGADHVEEPRPAADEKQEDHDDLYVPASLEHDPRVPVFSRREHFVHDVVTDHPLIARAFVNRIWAMLMGRGIVHPFDEMDSTHDPSHPELLDWLAEDFRQSGHDVRRLIRAVALSQPYRLQSARPQGLDDPSLFAWSLEKPLTAEQLARSAATALRGPDTDDQQTNALLAPLRTALPHILSPDTVPTVKTALFLSNNPALNGFIDQSQQPSHLIPQLIRLNSDEERIDRLFQTVFGRTASSDERQVLQSYLASDTTRLNERLNQAAWSLLTSAEFHFNH